MQSKVRGESTNSEKKGGKGCPSLKKWGLAKKNEKKMTQTYTVLHVQTNTIYNHTRTSFQLTHTQRSCTPFLNIIQPTWNNLFH